VDARCKGCGSAFPVDGGVIVLSAQDELYEDQMTEPLFAPAFERYRGPLRAAAAFDFRVSAKQTRLRFLYEVVQSLHKTGPLTVLDVGSGGGKQVLTRLGPVAGVDISLRALANARAMYDLCVRHDLRNGLPFSDSSFDVVNCSDVLGHFAPEDQDRILNEVSRVLRPGGHLVAFVETWSSRYDEYLRKFPDWYPRFVEEMVRRTGHIGLVPASEVDRRFASRGFRTIRRERLASRWGYARGHTTWAMNAYPSPSARETMLRRVSELATRNLFAEAVLDDILGVLDLPFRRRASDQEAIGLLLWTRKELS
jgi:SAM-dependent methyltransferase